MKTLSFEQELANSALENGLRFIRRDGVSVSIEELVFTAAKAFVRSAFNEGILPDDVIARSNVASELKTEADNKAKADKRRKLKWIDLKLEMLDKQRSGEASADDVECFSAVMECLNTLIDFGNLTLDSILAQVHYNGYSGDLANRVAGYIVDNRDRLEIELHVDNREADALVRRLRAARVKSAAEAEGVARALLGWKTKAVLDHVAKRFKEFAFV